MKKKVSRTFTIFFQKKRIKKIFNRQSILKKASAFFAVQIVLSIIYPAFIGRQKKTPVYIWLS
jgi:hypothetical protein